MRRIEFRNNMMSVKMFSRTTRNTAFVPTPNKDRPLPKPCLLKHRVRFSVTPLFRLNPTKLNKPLPGKKGI